MPDRLSAFDSSLLYLEHPTTPMHVGNVAIFRRPAAGFDYGKLVDLVERRLSLVPRYRQVVAPVPGNLARPVWIDDETFDITYHVRRSALPAPGAREQLDELVARLLSRRLDHDRPLWEVYLVEGLRDDELAVITKTHTAMVDGIDAFELCQAILDEEPAANRDDAPLWMPRPVPSGAKLVVDAVREVVRSPAALIDNVQAAAGDATATATKVLDAFGGVAAAARAALRPAPESPLNVRIGSQRRFAGASTELTTYRKIRAMHDCTVNDVVLTVITGALRAWLLSRGETVGETTSVRALVPLSAVQDAEHVVTPYLVDLPVGEPNAVVRLEHVRHQLRAHAESGRSVAAEALMRAGGMTPPTLHALGARAVNALSRRLFNIVVTNVPGPQVPLYAGGARMTQWFPVPPLARDQALAIGVSSYDGGVYFGLNADRGAMPDVDNLGRMLEEALSELNET
jgi:WS/DGAT/MGAT family acyltransferase